MYVHIKGFNGIYNLKKKSLRLCIVVAVVLKSLPHFETYWKQGENVT